MNKNKLQDLDCLIDRLKATYGTRLEHLSLLGNPLCPYPIFQGSTSGAKQQDNRYSK